MFWLVGSSFLERGAQHTQIDLAIGLVFLADFLARLWVLRKPLPDIACFWGVADILVIV